MPKIASTNSKHLKTGHVYKVEFLGGYRSLTVTGAKLNASEFCVMKSHIRTEFFWQNRVCGDLLYLEDVEVDGCQLKDFKVLDHLGKLDLNTELGGTPVLVHAGQLYIGRIRYTAKAADKLVKKIATALGFEVTGV